MSDGKRNSRQVMKSAFLKSIPIMCSYLFVSIAYGMMMENAGYHWYYSLLASMTIYTGAFQFVLITFLSSDWTYYSNYMSLYFWTDGIYAAGINLCVWHFDVLEWKKAERRQ